MNNIKIYGYSNEYPDSLLEMKEVAFQLTPMDLRRLATFFSDAANTMEENPDIDHIHLRDEIADWRKDLPDIVIAPLSLNSSENSEIGSVKNDD